MIEFALLINNAYRDLVLSEMKARTIMALDKHQAEHADRCFKFEQQVYLGRTHK